MNGPMVALIALISAGMGASLAMLGCQFNGHWSQYRAIRALAERIWQPIATAPLGARVMIYTTNPKKPFDVAYAPYVIDPQKDFTTTEGDFKVTHWMPLPGSPE